METRKLRTCFYLCLFFSDIGRVLTKICTRRLSWKRSYEVIGTQLIDVFMFNGERLETPSEPPVASLLLPVCCRRAPGPSLSVCIKSSSSCPGATHCSLHQPSALRSLCRWEIATHTHRTVTMAFFIAVAILSLVVSIESSVGPSTNTSFCTESKECLEYELVCKTDEYEVRHLTPTRWVSTDAEAYFMGVGAAMAFRRLFQYINGANDEGLKMEMTAPVLVKVPEETKLWEPAVYTLNFPLPAAYQDKPPAPTNDKVYFTAMPDMDVYVRSYGGWMLSVTSRLHSHLLTKELERVHASYNHTYHYGVGYDSPLKLLNRHNEVWYVAEGEPVCTDPREPTPAHTPRPTPTHLLTDSPSEMLSDSPYLPPSNLSSNTTFNSSSSSLLPSDPSAILPSETPASNSSEPHTEAAFSHPPSSALMAEDPTVANASVPASASPSLELEREAGAWNFTTSSSVDTQANAGTEVQPDDAH